MLSMWMAAVGSSPSNRGVLRTALFLKLHWYAMRWKIEAFHKILKSGCKAEEARLRTAEGLVRLIAVFCILAWRVFWMTMINRAAPGAKPELAITTVELKVIDRLIVDKPAHFSELKPLSSYLIKIARWFIRTFGAALGFTDDSNRCIRLEQQSTL